MNMKTFGDIVTEEEINVGICKEVSSENYRLMINRKAMKFSEFTLPIGTTGYFVIPPALEICWHVESFSMYEAIHNEQRTLMEEVRFFRLIINFCIICTNLNKFNVFFFTFHFTTVDKQ